MAEVLGSAEIDVFYRSREDQLRKSVNDSAERVERGQQNRPLTVPTRVDEKGMVASLGRVHRAAQAFLAFEGLRVGARALGSLVEASSRLEEQQNAVNVTFKESEGIVNRYAENAGRSAGIAESSALRAMAAFGGLFTNLGITNDEAAKLSAGAVQLAGDLASIRDIKVEDALQRISGGLVGETEPLRRVGVILSDVAVRNKAVELGFADTAAAVTDNARVLARYHIITEQLAEAQGDYVNTADSVANSQRGAAAAAEKLSATLGDTLGPTVADASQGFGALADIVDTVAKRLGTGGLGNVVAHIAKTINPLLGVLDAARRLRELFGGAESTTDAYADAQDALKSATDSLNASLSTETDLMRSIRDGTADLVGMQIDRIEAQFSTERSSMRMVEADMRVTDAQARLNEVLQRTGEYTERVTAAQERARSAEDALTDARRRAVQAEERRADAADAVAAAEFRFGVQSREAEEARRNLRDSTWEAEEAQEAIADVQRDAAAAQRELTEAQQAGGPRSREAAEAQLALSRAIADQREAVVTDAEAHLRLIDTTKALNGETLTAGERAKIFTERLNAVASTLAPDSPLRRHITDTTAAMAELAAVSGGFSLGPGNTAPTRAQLTAPPGGMRLGPGHDTPRGGTVIIQNMHINNAVDARQVAYDIAWQAGGSR